METSRKDVIRDKRKVLCLNSTFLGYSSYTLRYGDMFLYREHYTNGESAYRLAKCHGRIKPIMPSADDKLPKGGYFILAQCADNTMQYTYERWINPIDVVETIPKDRINSHIAALFTEKENMWRV